MAANKTRKSSRRTNPPSDLADFVVDSLVAKATTLQQLSDAVKHELTQVESLIRHLTPVKHDGTEKHNAVQFRATEDVKYKSLQLELESTRGKLELAKLQRETLTVNNTSSESKMAVQPSTAAVPGDPSVKPTLKTLHQDPAEQTEISDLLKSLGEPVVLGLTDAEQDPSQQLLEPEATAVRGKYPLLIPDFISAFPLVLHEDRETILGTSGDAKIVLKSSNEKKLSLEKITFLSGPLPISELCIP